MKIKIRGIVDYNLLESERLILDVQEDADIGEYLVLSSTFTKTLISNKVKNPCWFPDKEVKKGDVIILYTKRGRDNSKIETNYTSHYFYWGLESSVWNDDVRCVLLMHIDEWKYKKTMIVKFL